MEKYTNEERSLIDNLNKPTNNINMTLVESIVNKLLLNKECMELIHFLNNLYDLAEMPNDIVAKLIKENNKECVSIFLENENILFFLTNVEINKLKSFLNAHEVNIKLKESYDYYYNLLFKQDVRHLKSTKINDEILEHTFTKYNEQIGIKLKEIKDVGLVVSFTNYRNYNMSEEEQILKSIDYINSYNFNINREVDNETIIRNLVI